MEDASIPAAIQPDIQEPNNASDPPLGASPVPVEVAPSGQKGSPTTRTSPRKPGANQLTIDPTATLAAISARLSSYVPPAETEIARIKRLTFGSIAGRDQVQLSIENSSDPYAEDDSSIAQHSEEESDAGSSEDKYTSASNEKGVKRSPKRVSGATGISPASTSAGAGSSVLHDSVIAEEWVNVHLETSGSYLLPAADIDALFKATAITEGRRSDDAIVDGDDPEAFAFRRNGPLARAGIDRFSLYRLGMPKELVDRLFRALYVYTNGFHNIINEIASHCPSRVEKHVSSNVWLTFLLLLEQCENGKYEMAMLKFKHATEDWRKRTEEERESERASFEALKRELELQLHAEATRSAEKSVLIEKLANESALASQTIVEQQRALAATSEQIRLLKLELLAREHAEKLLNEQLDDARRDYEIANSERLNALSDKFALDDDMRKLQAEVERLDAEKAATAKRMHETLFMNQALRANNESLKQSAVVLNLDKEKLTSDKHALIEQIEQARLDIDELKSESARKERALADSQRQHNHAEARLQTMKEHFELEVEATSRQTQEVARLAALLDEEKVKVGVLEAKCNLLTAEKQNTGMRAQDKLRIERLLNQKLELDNTLEAMKAERAKDHEQIWNLRASLEALDSEMQHSKRVFSAGQQAFLHSERACEQLRHQVQDLEKNYEKATKTLASLRERFKLFEESSKEQITKLEVELKVTTAQLREVSYVNRDNAAQLAEKQKSLEAASKEAKSLRTRLETCEIELVATKSEKDDLQRDKKQHELQSSTSKTAFLNFIGSVQHMLALVKIDEFPLDEALRELLRMIKETFGEDLGIDRLLDHEDEAEEFEEELDEDDEREEQERRRRRRRAIVPEQLDGEDGANEEQEDDEDCGSAEGRRRTQTTRMSRYRKSKLDSLVKKLQKETALKAELIASLQGVVCDQTELIHTRENVIARLEARVALFTNHKEMLGADVDATWLALQGARQDRKNADVALEEARVELALENNRAFLMQEALQTTRQEYDRQCQGYEDLMSKMWRAYEHYLYMLSLRRDEAVQATVNVTDSQTQTLIPQRNPAMDRPRVAPMIMPAMNPNEGRGSLIDEINKAARVLLPGVARDIGPYDVAFADRSQTSNARLGRQQNQREPSPLAASRKGRRLHTSDLLPNVQAPSQIIRHVNEFGTRQDILISPGYPPFFGSGSKRPQKPAGSPRRKKGPRHRTGDSDRSHRDDSLDDEAVDEDQFYSRGLLHAGMEVLRHGKRSPRKARRRGPRYNDDGDDYGDDADDSPDDDGSDDPGDDTGDRIKSQAEIRSPGRLEAAVRSQRQRDAANSPQPRRLKRVAHTGAKGDELRSPRRMAASESDSDVDAEVLEESHRSPFVPAVLYPLFPRSQPQSAPSSHPPETKSVSK